MKDKDILKIEINYEVKDKNGKVIKSSKENKKK